MKAMIFAAGLGTRLKPLTDNVPKALVPVCGRPLLDHVMDKVFAAKDAFSGRPLFDEAVLNVHHFADKIEAYVAERRDLSGKVRISDERSCLLETGGGVLNARRLLEGCGNFLVHNVDILSDADLSWLASVHRSDAVATLLVSERRTSRYLLFDPDDMRLKGWMNVATGEIRSPFPDLDPSSCRRLAFSGIHMMSEAVFDHMQAYADARISGCGVPARFPIMDFYLSVCGTVPVYGATADNLNMVDVGKLDSLDRAEAFLSSETAHISPDPGFGRCSEGECRRREM